MSIKIEEKDINKFIVVGDKVLIKPKTDNNKTDSGLFLPPGISQKEKLYSGYILKVGPGYPIPTLSENHEPWQVHQEDVKYISLQAKSGDLAIYIQKNAYEIEFNKEKYIIIPHDAILLLIRDDEFQI